MSFKKLFRPNFSSIMAFLFIAIISTSFVNNQDNVLALLAGSRFTGINSVYLRSLKDVGLLFTSLLFLFVIIAENKKMKLRKMDLALILSFMGYCLLEVLYTTAIMQIPIIVPILGLRVFEVLPIAFIAYYFASYYESLFVSKIMIFLRYYILLEAIVSLLEIIYAPPVFGSSIFGTRPFGTFASPNTFGMAMLICGLFFLFARFDGFDNYIHKNNSGIYFYICMTLGVLSGSRQVIIGVALLLGVYAWKRILLKSTVKGAVVMLSPMILLTAYIISSYPAISGRHIEIGTGEKRINVWIHIFSHIVDATTLLFGWGLGLGSDTVNNVFGHGRFVGQFIADGQYVYLISSGGLLGLIFYLFLIVYFSFFKFKNFELKVLGIMTLLMGLSVSIWEVFPANMLLMILWGLLLGRPTSLIRSAS